MARAALQAARRDRDAQSLTLRQPVEPAGLALDGDAFAGKKRHGEILCIGGVGEGMASGRVIQRGAEGEIGGRGDGRHATGERGDAARQVVGAVMAADERYRGAAVFGHGDDRRLVLFVGEKGADEADQDAGRTDADEGAPGEESRDHPLARLAVRRGDIGLKRRLQPLGQRVRGGGEGDEERAGYHGSPPL